MRRQRCTLHSADKCLTGWGAVHRVHPPQEMLVQHVFGSRRTWYPLHYFDFDVVCLQFCADHIGWLVSNIHIPLFLILVI